jgi:hypothetical protein
MQPIAIIQDPTHSAQYITCIERETRLIKYFHRYYMYRGLPCTKEKKLASVMLHKVVPQVPLQEPPSPAGRGQ